MSDNHELGAVDREMMEQLDTMIPSAQLAESKDPTGWIIEWFMRQEVELTAAEEAIKTHVELLLNQIEAKRKGLEYKWGPQFRQEAEARLKAETKARSFLTPFGRIGHRSQGGKPVLVIDDEAKAIAAAEIVWPEAVKKSLLKTQLQKYAETAGEALEGTHVETPPKHDVFFAGKRVFGEKTFEGYQPPQLEGESDGNDSRED